ncbi:hypothetical protein BH23BAC1_BH23BAC1_09220 [soil metagenome]|jgi:hypothetical protein
MSVSGLKGGNNLNLIFKNLIDFLEIKDLVII